MSLLLKMSPYVSELSLFDIVNTPGVASDLSHIDTESKVPILIFWWSQSCFRCVVTRVPTSWMKRCLVAMSWSSPLVSPASPV